VFVLFPCPCGQTLRAKNQDAGRSVDCPSCHATLRVPGTLPRQRALWLAGFSLLALGLAAGAIALILRALSPTEPERHDPPSKGALASGNDRDAGRSEKPEPLVPAILESTPKRDGSPPLTISGDIVPPPELHTVREPPTRSSELQTVREPPSTRTEKKTESYLFYQVVEVSRVSTFRVLDSDIKQGARYTIVSGFQIERKTADGGLVVRQKVEAVKLGEADAALQAQLNGLLQKMRGATFTLTLDAEGQVTRFEGEPDAIKVLTGSGLLGGQSFLMWSFLDQDGWKELAQATFFQPAKPLKPGATWSRKMAHSWGPLGRWTGQVVYAAAGKQGEMERIDYRLDLAYQPPRKGEATGLPFEVGRADFRLRQASGSLLYDPVRKRVAAAEERFHVVGRLPVAALGVTAVVDMEEVQLFKIRITEENPLKPATPRGPADKS
jgi:hypothetical protein